MDSLAEQLAMSEKTQRHLTDQNLNYKNKTVKMNFWPKTDQKLPKSIEFCIKDRPKLYLKGQNCSKLIKLALIHLKYKKVTTSA